MMISSLSIWGAFLIEPMIAKEVLDFLVQVIAVTLSITLWIRLSHLVPSLFICLIAFNVHHYCSLLLVRQIILTFLIAGTLIAIKQALIKMFPNLNND